jgi:hypothetical protein
MLIKFNIAELHRAIRSERVSVTDHALKQAEERDITLEECYDSVFFGEIIEYPSEGCKPCPKCLICGQTPKGRYIHTCWAYNDQKQLAILVTVYDPSETASAWRWFDKYRKRRQT